MVKKQQKKLLPVIKKKEHRLKIILIVFIFLFLLPLIIMAAVSSQSLFANAADLRPYDVEITEVSKSRATIGWVTTKNSQSIIEYGTNRNQLNSYAPESIPAKEHTVELSLLTPATTYYFQIRSGGEVFQNDGVPWTFTTKTKDGEEVKGVSTDSRDIGTDRISPSQSRSTVTQCSFTSCDKIKSYLGRGCSSSDYIRCIGETDATPSAISPTIAFGQLPDSFITSYPTPSPIYMRFSDCALRYLSANSCTSWVWDSMNIKPQKCRDAFDRYIFQCKSETFEKSATSGTWYFNGAVTDIASSSASIPAKGYSTPADGTKVYCRIRAEDALGGDSHATPWIEAAKTCE